ncbi:hypothetical protein B0T18DRAFT_160464 [Schizothecium vesticola]|uniref:Uncharacterized protein n=1 Tax=Schizothecium vesticola TaxID=314040 RepID=A0AA40EWY7_9PEZI|nr:hypothetical protein B0T18DRAFT_160464 [Schizothecium vesticola]
MRFARCALRMWLGCIVIPGRRNGAVTTAHQVNNRGCGPPPRQQRTGASANTDGVCVVWAQQSCCCAIAWPVAFAPSCDRQQRCHHCVQRVDWCRQDSNAETTVVRPLGDMRRRDGPRPSKRGSRDGGDLRRVRERHTMVPPMKIAHPQHSPNPLNIKMELTQRPWRLLSHHITHQTHGGWLAIAVDTTMPPSLQHQFSRAGTMSALPVCPLLPGIRETGWRGPTISRCGRTRVLATTAELLLQDIAVFGVSILRRELRCLGERVVGCVKHQTKASRCASAINNERRPWFPSSGVCIVISRDSASGVISRGRRDHHRRGTAAGRHQA